MSGHIPKDKIQNEGINKFLEVVDIEDEKKPFTLI